MGEIKNDMGEFYYETHLHTLEGSACGDFSGRDYAKAYKKAGYDGIIVTDHFFNGNTAAPRLASWERKVEILCSGYENAKRIGDEIGLKVFFGWEAGYTGTEFLIYGLTKEWLIEHPQIIKCSIQEQYEMVHQAGGMVIHAHPFREAIYIPSIRLEPKFVDGVEVYNRANEERNPSFNKKAYQYAKEYGFPMTCGSDIHRKEDPKCAMCFEKPLHSIEDFITVVLSKKGYKIETG